MEANDFFFAFVPVHSDYFVFALTHKSGKRVYGHCLRYLPPERGCRLDLGVRRHWCLCILSHQSV